jgi:hypothetical protein
MTVERVSLVTGALTGTPTSAAPAFLKKKNFTPTAIAANTRSTISIFSNFFIDLAQK